MFARIQTALASMNTHVCIYVCIHAYLESNNPKTPAGGLFYRAVEARRARYSCQNDSFNISLINTTLRAAQHFLNQVHERFVAVNASIHANGSNTRSLPWASNGQKHSSYEYLFEYLEQP